MVFINKKIEIKCISFLSIARLIRIDLQMCLRTPVRKEDKKEQLTDGENSHVPVYFLT